MKPATLLAPILIGLTLSPLCRGDTWDVVSSGTSEDLTGVTWDGLQFVAVDTAFNPGVLVSPDGRNWTREQFPYPAEQRRGITAGGGHYFAWGFNGEYRHSTDLSSWTERDTGFSNSLNAGIWHDGLFLAVGESGIILTSTDAASWTKNFTSPTTSPLNCATYGKGLFVIGGTNGIFTSPAASVWTPRPSGTLFPVTGVAVNDQRFVAVSWGEVLTSTTGTSWSKNWIDLGAGTPYATAVCAGDGRFVIVCKFGKAFETTDGVSCSAINLLATSHINSVAYGAGAFVAVGDNGLIRVSGEVVPPAVPLSLSVVLHPQAADALLITMGGEPGGTYNLDYSLDLHTWYPHGEFTMEPDGTKSFGLAIGENYSELFFRLRAP